MQSRGGMQSHRGSNPRELSCGMGLEPLRNTCMLGRALEVGGRKGTLKRGGKGSAARACVH